LSACRRGAIFAHLRHGAGSWFRKFVEGQLDNQRQQDDRQPQLPTIMDLINQPENRLAMTVSMP